MADNAPNQPRRKVFNCIVDDTALIAGVKKSTRDGIRKWINNGAINLLVPLHTLTQVHQLKDGDRRINRDAQDAIQWLDDVTSTTPAAGAGTVELQGAEEEYRTWQEVEQHMMPETLLSMESDDADSFDDITEELEKSLVMKTDEESVSSTDSLEARSQSPSSRRSTNSSVAPELLSSSPNAWAHRPSSKHSNTSRPRTPAKRTTVPPQFQPLFNHIVWRLHADPRAGYTTPDSYLLLTNDPVKQSLAQKFGIRAKRLEQLRDIIAREERDYKNRLLVLRKEAALSESELAAQNAKKEQEDDDEEVVVFRPRQAQAKPQPQPQQKVLPPTGPKVVDPHAFARPGQNGPRAGRCPRGRGGFGPGGRGRNAAPPVQPVSAHAKPIDLTQPIDPDSFDRPAAFGRGGRGGRGGRRRLWEAT